ncbi:MAG: hypothetical protein BIFFINMI_00814 [Phycisphaerae bacterium]|nr:hypothetical protein [Phycisphaerae bacterium]
MRRTATLVLSLPAAMLLASCAVPQMPMAVMASDAGQPPAGVTLGAAGPVASPAHGGQFAPAVAFGADTYLLVWQEGFSGAGGGSDILAQRISPDGATVGEPLTVCAQAGAQETPAVAYCSGHFLVVWADRRGRDSDIYGAIVTPDGQVTPTEGFLIAGRSGAQVAPAVTTDGKGQFLVVWQGYVDDHFEIHGARIDAANGTLTDKMGFTILDRGERPSVAWTGSNYLVCQKWYAALVSSQGKVVVPTTQVWVDKIAGASVAVGAWGDGYVFMNSQPFPDPWGWSGNGAIAGARLLADGSLPELKASEPFRRGGGERFAGAKADGRVPNCLDAARWFNHPGWPMGMRGALKHTMGDNWPTGTPAACYDGRSLVVVWSCGQLVDTRRLNHRRLYMTRMLPGWGLIDRPAALIVADRDEAEEPVLAAGPTGQSLLAYQRVNADGPAVVWRLLSEAADKGPPKVEYVVPASDTEWIVRFDEPVAPGSIKAGGFRLFTTEEGPAPLEPAAPLQVKDAALNADGRGQQREVVLTLAEPLKRDRQYILQVSGIADRSPAANAVTTARYAFLAQPGTMVRTDYVDHWITAGPFPRDLKNHPFDPATVQPADGDAIKTAAGEVKWSALNAQAVDLGRRLGEDGNQLAYAMTYFYSDRARDAVLRLDTNDHNRAWLNGRLVHDGISGATASRGFHDSVDVVPVHLAAGANRLLLEVENRLTTWMMVAQITDAAGQPLGDLTWLPGPSGSGSPAGR